MTVDEALVYKVVSYINGKMFSARIRPEYQLCYQLGVRTYPKIGKIFAFEDIDSAINFKSSTERILECITTSKIIRPKSFVFSPVIKLEDFWKKYKNKEKISYYTCNQKIPQGTIWLDNIQPIRVISHV